MQSKSKSNRNVIARAKPKAESNRIIATLAWKCHALAPPDSSRHHHHLDSTPSETRTPHTHLSIGTQAAADIYSRLIFMVTIFAFNRKSMKFLCLRLGALYFIYVCAYFCMCWQNIFHSKYFVCVTTRTHTHIYSPQAFALELDFPFPSCFSSIEFRQFGGLTKSFLVLMNLYVLFVQCMQNSVLEFRTIIENII